MLAAGPEQAPVREQASERVPGLVRGQGQEPVQASVPGQGQEPVQASVPGLVRALGREQEPVERELRREVGSG